MPTHQKELTYSGSRFELRPYIVSDPAKPPMVPSQKKNRNSQIFFLQSPVARRLLFPMHLTQAPKTGCPSPALEISLLEARPLPGRSMMDSALIVSLDVDDRGKAVPAAKSFVL